MLMVSSWSYVRPLSEPARGDTDRWESVSVCVCVCAAGRGLELLLVDLVLMLLLLLGLLLELLLLLLELLLQLLLLLALAETERRGGIGVEGILVHARLFLSRERRAAETRRDWDAE